MTKSEKREHRRMNRNKMSSSARSFYQLIHIRAARLLKEHGKILQAELVSARSKQVTTC